MCTLSDHVYSRGEWVDRTLSDHVYSRAEWVALSDHVYC